MQEILSHKGTDVHTVTPDATLQVVVDKLVEFNVGSLVVVETGSGAA